MSELNIESVAWEITGAVECLVDSDCNSRASSLMGLIKSLTVVFDERDQLRQKLEAAEAHGKYLEQAIHSVRTGRDAFEQVIREAREQKPYYHLNDGIGLIPLYKSPVPAMPIQDDINKSTFALWWSMIEAENNLAEKPIKDFEVILHYMGCGASCQVTAGDIRKILGREQSEVKPL